MTIRFPIAPVTVATVLALGVAAAQPSASRAAPGEISAAFQTMNAPLRANLRFLVVDPVTRRPIPGASVTIEDVTASGPGAHTPRTLWTGFLVTGPTAPFDASRWTQGETASVSGAESTLVVIPAGTAITLRQSAAKRAGAPPASGSGASAPPPKDIYVKVTASRLPPRTTPVTSAGATRSNQEINTFVNRTSNDTRALTQGQSGVASDSNGQQHIRGEHADIAFVVDGVPLPDTLSGRQGSVVVASTIQSLDIVTGGFAPEFGGQTAAVLNIATLPGVSRAESDITLQGGEYDTFNTALTASGPIGSRASYVVNIATTRTQNALEPQQPDNQTAHNAGQDESYFAKLRFSPARADAVTLTLSRAPGRLELSNRTGLAAARFAQAGQGYGFLGQRNADGTRPDVTPETTGLLGAQTLPLSSQQEAGQAILQHEVNEFATLTWRHQINARDSGQLAAVLLHSGQEVSNRNPAVRADALPVDNSIEYNPSASRSVYHYQISGDLSARRGAHQLKAGFLSDQQKGDESYQLVPASQLALDALAGLDPTLAPLGAIQTDATGNDIADVNGNPVYIAASGATSPTLRVHRTGFYRAAYAQDTWQASRALTLNYGLRYDRYRQAQNLGQPIVDKEYFSPRLNLSYALGKATLLRASYDRLMNTAPLAQGAVVGQPIQPETLNQYDVSLERQVAFGQTAKAAYYYKQIFNQVDTGLLIPGSQIGLYSALNLQYGGVHGIELSYDVSPRGGVGIDGYLNYTYSIAKPNGLDNTGSPVPEFNDHDQTHTVGAGLGYLWRGGASAALTLAYGSGLASSPIPPSLRRIPRSQVDLRLTTGPRPFGGRGGVGLDISNLLDDREVINFQSAFSGTRFQQGRRVLFSVFGSF